MFDRVRRKRPPSKDNEDLLWNAETFTKLARPVTERWPEVREKIAPVAQIVGEKLGDVYASVAQVVTEKKEALDDHLAERRARKQGSPTPSEGAAKTDKS